LTQELMGTTQKEAFLKDIQDDQSFTTMLETIKSETSDTFMPTDRVDIVALMQQNGIGFAEFDPMLFDLLDAWMIRTVETQIDCKNDAGLLPHKAKWLAVLGNIYCNKASKERAKH
ncbi:hypothetical protein As57867_009701, partial [Aphanomyces stellatus]